MLPGAECAASDECGLTAAISTAASMAGLPVVLKLAAGEHAAAIVFDGSVNASEVWLQGEPGAELRSTGDAPLLVILPGAPPLHLVGLALYGAVEVQSGSLDASGCSFRPGGGAPSRLLTVVDGFVVVETSRFENGKAGGVEVRGGTVAFQYGA